MIALYFEKARFTEALSLGNWFEISSKKTLNYSLNICVLKGAQLLKELKKLDDKQLLVEVQLLESKTYHAISNLSKAR